MLEGLGYDETETNGNFGDGTKAAVEAFQRANDLNVTGEINEKTGGALEEKVVEEMQKEDNDKQLQKALEVLFSS